MMTREKIKEIVDVVASPVLEMMSEFLLDGTVGTVIPGVGNMILAYKQKRAEKNAEKLISEIWQRQEEFDEKLKKLDFEKMQEITHKYFDLITEYAVNERQEKKIEYIVNGFIKLPEQGDFTEDFVLLYYDTLAELTLLDIRVMKLCLPGQKEDNSMKVMEDCKIDSGQLRYIVDKLYRKGLFEEKSEENIDRNFQKVLSMIKDNTDEELVKVGYIGSHQLSEFGKNFLEFFLKR